jgi:O-antigen/teichoic acid export membrane protein
VWFALLNLGIPAAVQNLVSKYRAQGQIYEQLKNTSFSLLAILFLPVVLLIGLAAKHWLLDSFQIVNVSTVLAACTLIFISGLGQLFNAVLYAEQRGVWPNVYPAINSIGISICLLILARFNISNFNIVLFIFLIPNLTVFIVSSIQLKAFRKWNLDFKITRIILKDSKGFCLFATLSACTLAVDYFVMSKILQANDIVQYNLSSRIFLTILIINSILLATKWPEMSELMHSGKLKEARSTIQQILKQGLVFGLLSGCAIVLSMNWIISIISGGKVASITLLTSISWLLYILIRIWSDTFAMSLLCIGKTWIFNRYIPIQALISITGQYYLGEKFGLSGIILGLIISFLATAAWILPINFLKISKGK